MKIVRVHYEWVDKMYANYNEQPGPPAESIHLQRGT
jgi:hypothetical protein